MSKKATSIEKDQRTLEVLELIKKKETHYKITEFLMDTYGIGSRQARTYIANARAIYLKDRIHNIFENKELIVEYSKFLKKLQDSITQNPKENLFLFCLNEGVPYIVLTHLKNGGVISNNNQKGKACVWSWTSREPDANMAAELLRRLEKDKNYIIKLGSLSRAEIDSSLQKHVEPNVERNVEPNEKKAIRVEITTTKYLFGLIKTVKQIEFY